MHYVLQSVVGFWGLRLQTPSVAIVLNSAEGLASSDP